MSSMRLPSTLRLLTRQGQSQPRPIKKLTPSRRRNVLHKHVPPFQIPPDATPIKKIQLLGVSKRRAASIPGPVTRSVLEELLPVIPPYPYGANTSFPPADRGLYGGVTRQSGNKISKGRNKGKTKRMWYPNVRMERIRSEALDHELYIPITARCMRTIKKCGGLDQYVLGEKPARIKELGLFGWLLRWKVMNSPSMVEKYARERANLGLPPAPASFNEAWEDDVIRTELIEAQDKKWQALRAKSERFERHFKEKLQKADKSTFKIPDMFTLKTQSPATIRLVADAVKTSA